MLEQNKISISQFSILVIMFLNGGNFILVPSILTGQVGQDGWIANIVGVGIGLLFVFLYNAFLQRFPNITLAQCNEVILGKWLGILVSLFFYIYSFILCSILIRQIGDFMVTQIMPETPIEVIHILFVVLVIMGVRLGIETIARSAEICFPMMILLFLLVLLISPEIKVDKIQPVFEESVGLIFLSGFFYTGLSYVQLFIFIMISPAIKRTSSIKPRFLLSALIGGVMVVIITFLTISVLGTDTVIRNIYPSYILAKKISIGDILERIEVIVAGIWFITIYFKVTLLFYFLSFGLSQTLKLKDYRSLTIPLGMFVSTLSIFIFPNIISFKQSGNVMVMYSVTAGLLLPLLLLGVAVVRKV